MAAPRPVLQELDAVRAVAVHRAMDPISLCDLRSRSDQVGALVLDGQRVEQPLYHMGSVQSADGRLTVANNVSPVTFELANGFKLVPPLAKLEEFIRFLDWDGDHMLSVTEIAAALAALLPVDEEGAEHFIRDHFDVGQDGLIEDHALHEQMLPYTSGDRLYEFLEAAPVEEAPALRRGSSRQELLRWFDHWDTQGSGELDLREVRFAVAWTLYQALGSSEDHVTKETLASLFLAQAELTGEGQHISRDQFVELFAPALQANLPESLEPAERQLSHGTFGVLATGDEEQPRGPRTGDEMLAEVMGERPKRGGGDAPVEAQAPAGGALRLTLHAPVAGGVFTVDLTEEDAVESLRASAAQYWPKWGAPRLYCCGRPLSDGAARLGSVQGLRRGAVVQVLPGTGSSLHCAVS